MSQDSLVDEVRAVREAYARSCEYDIARICADLRARDLESGVELVSLPARRIMPSDNQARGDARSMETP